MKFLLLILLLATSAFSWHPRTSRVKQHIDHRPQSQIPPSVGLRGFCMSITDLFERGNCFAQLVDYTISTSNKAPASIADPLISEIVGPLQDNTEMIFATATNREVASGSPLSTSSVAKLVDSHVRKYVGSDWGYMIMDTRIRGNACNLPAFTIPGYDNMIYFIQYAISFDSGDSCGGLSSWICAKFGGANHPDIVCVQKAICVGPSRSPPGMYYFNGYIMHQLSYNQTKHDYEAVMYAQVQLMSAMMNVTSTQEIVGADTPTSFSIPGMGQIQQGTPPRQILCDVNPADPDAWGCCGKVGESYFLSTVPGN